MKINLSYDMNQICRTIVEEQLSSLQIEFEVAGTGEVIFKKPVPDSIYKDLESNLLRYGIAILQDPKKQLIQRIMNVISKMISLDTQPCKISYYLSKRLNMNYSYLSAIFSERTLISIESYIILQKIEKAKRLLLQKVSMTEISYMLHYSSPAHLSGQFKKVTGISPSAFKRIVEQRKIHAN